MFPFNGRQFKLCVDLNMNMDLIRWQMFKVLIRKSTQEKKIGLFEFSPSKTITERFNWTMKYQSFTEKFLNSTLNHKEKHSFLWIIHFWLISMALSNKIDLLKTHKCFANEYYVWFLTGFKLAAPFICNFAVHRITVSWTDNEHWTLKSLLYRMCVNGSWGFRNMNNEHTNALYCRYICRSENNPVDSVVVPVVTIHCITSY